MTVTIAEWAASLEKLLGITPNANDTTALEGWASAEGGGTSAQSPNVALYNPLNTTLKANGSKGFSPGSSVQSYSSLAQGLAATASTLKESQYAPVVADLAAQASPSTTWAAVAASPWGTSTFGLTTQSANAYASIPLTGTITSPPPRGLLGDALHQLDELRHSAAATADSARSATAGVAGAVAGGMVTGIKDVVSPVIHNVVIGLVALALVAIGIWVAIGHEGRQTAVTGAEVAA